MAEVKEKHPTWFKMKIERRQLIKQLPAETAVSVLLACWDFLETGEIGDMNSASMQEAIPHRPKSYDIGRYRAAEKKNQNQTIDYRRKEKRVCISLSLFASFSLKKSKPAFSREYHHIQEE